MCGDVCVNVRVSVERNNKKKSGWTMAKCYIDLEYILYYMLSNICIFDDASYFCEIRSAYKISNVTGGGSLVHREIGIKGSHICKQPHHIIHIH